ncbi:MAG: patatin-like phospholipase family protein, partial [Vicinamibacterales bacterium]|nr:patatin-like phospholipase family protein [Vicinamibacterales bacterium]
MSGGGIRSATTNLGILQALVEERLLPAVDYLCTVSGGGYIGGCLSSLLSLNENTFAKNHEADDYRLVKDGKAALFDTTQEKFPLSDERPPSPEQFGGRPQVAHLRTHGSFLIARNGLFRRDALRAVGNVFSGTTFTLLFTALTLLAIAASVMTVANALSGDLAGQLGLRGLTDNATLADRFGRVGEQMWLDVASWLAPGRWEALLRVAWPGATFAIVALFALALIVLVPVWLGDPAAGESHDDKRERRGLFLMGWILLGAVVWFTWRPAGAVLAPHWLLLFLPAALLVVTRLTSLVAAWTFIPWMPLTWRREIRSVWGAFQAVTMYAVAAALVFAFLPIAAHVFHDHGPTNAFAAIISLVAARGFLPSQDGDGGARRLPAALLRGVLGVAVWLFLLFAVLAWSIGLIHVLSYVSYSIVAVWTFVALVALGSLVNLNKVSLHYFYRDRLAEAYLRTETPKNPVTPSRLVTRRDSMKMSLTQLHGTGGTGSKPHQTDPPPHTTAPYHLISAAINLAGSRDLTRKDRKAGFFLFSKYFCGSKQTGYRRTEDYRGGETKLARAITISGAAAGSGMGHQTFFAQAFATTLFNIRLGYWMVHPTSRFQGLKEALVFWPWWLLKEIFSLTDARSRLVNLSDGGHTGDNVGIYPLLQRRCQVVIACDAEADPTLSFGSFTRALRHAYVDLGVEVDIDLDMIRPDPETGRSRSHCAVGRIRYRKDDNGKDTEETDPHRKNWLIYIKSSMTGDEPAPVQNYEHEHKTFPHETTADQFFDDDQFESYRALGVRYYMLDFLAVKEGARLHDLAATPMQAVRSILEVI